MTTATEASVLDDGTQPAMLDDGTKPAMLDDGTQPAVPGPGQVWVDVCPLDALVPERGAAALLGDEQVALVRLLDGRVLGVQQLDPFSGAHVISRGIVGSRHVDGIDVPTIASPMYKQVFDLSTGRCLDGVGKDPQDLRTFPVRVLDGSVQVAVAVGPRG